MTPRKKLVQIESAIPGGETLFALVNESTEQSVITSLVNAAISDATKKYTDLLTELESSTRDLDIGVEDLLIESLVPLGFEFIEIVKQSETQQAWDSGHTQQQTLLEMRLNMDGIAHEVLHEKGTILIESDFCKITVSLKDGKWKRWPIHGDSGFIYGSDYKSLVEDVQFLSSTVFHEYLAKRGFKANAPGQKIEWKSSFESGTFTFDQAIAAFARPNQDGWRLPTKRECLEVIQSVRVHKTAKLPKDTCFWTSSAAEEINQDYAWCVNSFRAPMMTYDYRSVVMNVLLVRVP